MQTDINALVAGIGGDGVASGCAVTAQSTPDMTVAVASGKATIGGTQVTVASGNVTITTADATNPRIDLIVVSNTGTKSATAGTAAANPKAPDIPASSILLAMVYVPASQTSITSGLIIDKRTVLPWAVANTWTAQQTFSGTSGTSISVTTNGGTGISITNSGAGAGILADSSLTGTAAAFRYAGTGAAAIQTIVIAEYRGTNGGTGAGPAIGFRSRSTTTAARDLGALSFLFADGTDASRKGRFTITVADATTNREAIRGESDGTRPNVGLLGASDYGSGSGVIAILNATTAPSGTPSGGGVLYVESGALKYKGSSGTVTTLGAA